MNDQETGLRARLVTAGVELLALEGVHALTLREIARRAGVSHGAPRRHFATHVELLAAIARHGFGELAAALARADDALTDTGDTSRGTDRDPRARIAALARAYLDFAAAQPGMFDLMFRHDVLEGSGIGLRDTSLPLFETFVRLIGEVGPPAGVRPADAAAALWANLHGLAQLRAWGSLRLASGSDDVGPQLEAALAAHLGSELR
ncbi:helix-turn-helix domain-containing protein [Kitasatospora sp. CM 4170]|uniref:TetR/AcrR family transcriptional regulator n=1 Tax=Kitasatospora aburaviensis TaxID=67265 RepID=A0ABW1EX19_9ACTN|nr:helix-turn-helix domain-containing protein [Kitasatospora sp. CM 4170]WNM43819.1 helix-turn-helix domain-containing protein [Kitasatospora sp. CM 4170]